MGVLETDGSGEAWVQSDGRPDPALRSRFLGLRDGAAETALHLLAFPGDETAADFQRPEGHLSVVTVVLEPDATASGTGALEQHLESSFDQPVRLIVLADPTGSCGQPGIANEALSNVARDSAGAVVDVCTDALVGFDSSHLIIAEHLERRPRTFELSRVHQAGTGTPIVQVRGREGAEWHPARQEFDEASNAVRLSPAPDGGATVEIEYCASGR